MSSRRYVSATTDRRVRPRNTKRWFRCWCGRWWGVNKHCHCVCGAAKGMSKADALTAQRQQRAHLIKLGWTPESVHGYMFRGERLVAAPWP